MHSFERTPLPVGRTGDSHSAIAWRGGSGTKILPIEHPMDTPSRLHGAQGRLQLQCRAPGPSLGDQKRPRIRGLTPESARATPTSVPPPVPPPHTRGEQPVPETHLANTSRLHGRRGAVERATGKLSRFVSSHPPGHPGNSGTLGHAPQDVGLRQVAGGVKMAGAARATHVDLHGTPCLYVALGRSPAAQAGALPFPPQARLERPPADRLQKSGRAMVHANAYGREPPWKTLFKRARRGRPS